MKKFFRFILVAAGVILSCIFLLLIIPDSWLGIEDEETASTGSNSETQLWGNPNGTNLPTGSGSESSGTGLTAGVDIPSPFGDDSDKAQSGNGKSEISTPNSSLLRSKGMRTGKDYSSAETVTILCYVNGSNLESEDQEATTDISEMVAAPFSPDVHIVIQTMGTRRWSTKYNIASDRSQRFLVKENGLELVDDSLGQLDCTRSSSLSDFITWGAKNYPADRYILLFWNHGGGPVYGFGYDEYQGYEDAMTIDEMQLAIDNAGVYFDFIGMDCCIMSCMEVCCALYGYCDYMVLSEDFEPGLGWSYEGWITAITKNPSIDTLELGKIICDDCVEANERDIFGDDCILAVLNESVMRVLFKAWTDFAYANETALLGSNYSRQLSRGQNYRLLQRLSDKYDDYALSDYYITDIMSVASNIESEEATALASAVSNAIPYVRSTSGDDYLTGLSVTLPYGNTEFYSSLKSIFTNCGFDEAYIDWLSKFTSAAGSSSYYNYDSWDDSWSGWSSYDDDYDWSIWDWFDDSDYWDDSSDDSWWDWDFLDFWDDDWSSYDDNDYHYDGYCSDDYWLDYGDYYNDYWDQGDYDDYGWDDWIGWGGYDDWDGWDDWDYDGNSSWDDYGSWDDSDDYWFWW